MPPEFGRVSLPLAGSVAEAISGFDCTRPDGPEDPVSENVCSFLRDHRFEAGTKHSFSSTYLLRDAEEDPVLIGYLTLSHGGIRLTNSEKSDVFGERPEAGEFGSVRIQMIGRDHRHRDKGYGRLLLHFATEIGRRQEVATRFLIADANLRQRDWYERQGFVPNTADAETKRIGTRSDRVISMRLDLANPGR